MNLKRLFQGVFISLAFLFVLGFLGWGMHWFSNSLKTYLQAKIIQEQNSFLGSIVDSITSNAMENKLPYRDENIPNLELFVESAISVQTDFENDEKILFAKNAEEKMPIASLTKLMTAVVILENYDITKNVSISRTAEKQDARGLLRTGDVFVAKDLLYDMLIESNNSAAYAFFETIGPDKFIKLMNLKANEIGLKNTYFSGPTGLALTNYSTAKDLADFAKYIFNNNQLIIEIASISEFDLYTAKKVFHHRVNNLNDLLEDPNLKERIIAGKTGQTKDAGECLLLILKAPEGKGFLFNVVLNAKDRFSEMKKIINWEDNAYIWK